PCSSSSPRRGSRPAGRRTSRLPRSPRSQTLGTYSRPLVREFFRDAAVVHDKRGGNAALPAVFFFVVHLDDLAATPVGHRNCVAVADRVAVVNDDPDLTASHVDQAKASHAEVIIQAARVYGMPMWLRGQ